MVRGDGCFDNHLATTAISSLLAAFVDSGDLNATTARLWRS
jgi:hypothetical protein